MSVSSFEEKTLRILDPFALQIKFMGDIQKENTSQLAERLQALENKN